MHTFLSQVSESQPDVLLSVPHAHIKPDLSLLQQALTEEELECRLQDVFTQLLIENTLKNSLRRHF